MTAIADVEGVLVEVVNATMFHRNGNPESFERSQGQAIRQLGQMLFEMTGSLDQLRQIVERIAERDPAYEGRRLSLLDHAFTGVGAGSQVWSA